MQSLARRSLAAAATCALLALAAPSHAAGGSFTTYVAQTKGFYAENNIEVTIPNFPSSDALRAALAKGDIQMANFGVDNALAMAEKKVADVVIIMGGENPPIQFVGNKGIDTVDQLKGKTILVDAPNTQNAVIMKRILSKQGLEAGRDYQMKEAGGQPLRLAELKKDPSLGGTMVSWPVFFQMQADGYKAFGSSLDVVGPMTFLGTFAKRDWAASHKELLERYFEAEIKTLRWMMTPANKAEVIDLLVKGRSFTPAVAALAYDGFMSPNGWARDGEVKPTELAALMKLGADVEGRWGGHPPPPETYLDLSYLHDAIAKLDAKK
jgi:ABC-type nitrate/sulfonate/bicarbonate transport system substrate-binding protein